MRTAGVGPPRQPAPAAALPHGDFTRRRQEGVRPENQQVRGFPRTSQLFLTSLSLRPGQGRRPGCGSGGGTAPPRETLGAGSHLPAPDSPAGPAAAARRWLAFGPATLSPRWPAFGRAPPLRCRAAPAGGKRCPWARPAGPLPTPRSCISRVGFCSTVCCDKV